MRTIGGVFGLRKYFRALGTSLDWRRSSLGPCFEEGRNTVHAANLLHEQKDLASEPLSYKRRASRCRRKAAPKQAIYVEGCHMLNEL